MLNVTDLLIVDMLNKQQAHVPFFHSAIRWELREWL